MKHLQLTSEELGTICRSLAYLLHAGSSSGDALALLAEDAQDAALEGKFRQMAQQTDAGESLSAAFRQAGCFPQYIPALLEVGERSGRTEEALNALCRFYEGRARMEKRLRAALLYPAVLLVVMLAVIVVLLAWVLPVFNEVYMQLGSGLTGIAGGLLSLGMALRHIMPVLCAVLAVILLLFILCFVSTRFRNKLLTLRGGKRPDRGIARVIDSARFAQALAMGMSSGFTPEDAATLALSLTEDSGAFHARCAACIDALQSGASLPRALGDAEILSRSDCRLLEAGIRGGNGETAMAQIADKLLEESELLLEAKVGCIEPTLVVITSVLVGLILLTVMLPLMHIMSTIG